MHVQHPLPPRNAPGGDDDRPSIVVVVVVDPQTAIALTTRRRRPRRARYNDLLAGAKWWAVFARGSDEHLPRCDYGCSDAGYQVLRGWDGAFQRARALTRALRDRGPAACPEGEGIRDKDIAQPLRLLSAVAARPALFIWPCGRARGLGDADVGRADDRMVRHARARVVI